MSAATAEFLSESSVPPLGGSTEFSLHSYDELRKRWANELERWEGHRDRGIPPKFHSGFAANEQNRIDFLTGADMMGYRLDADADLYGVPNTIKPQQLAIVDTLGAEFDEYVVEIPRRASKTTTIFCLLLGRMKNRPEYEVTFSAQSGVKGTARLREWKTRLDRTCPDPEASLAPWQRGRKPQARRPRKVLQADALFGGDWLPEQAAVEADDQPTTRGFRIMMGEVGKGIYFDNGSKMLVLKPDAEAARGEAADCSWLDEAQEIDPDEGDLLMAGLLPLLDTKPGASIIISGTAGEARVGPFWASLDRLRGDDAEMGGIDYAVDPETPWEHFEDEDTAMQLLLNVHPGIGTLTTVDKMRKNYRSPKFSLPQFTREYFSLWPVTFGETAIDWAKWEQAELKTRPGIPKKVAFGLSIKPGGSTAAICAAWRSESGLAYIEVIEHRLGTNWIPERMQQLTMNYRGSDVAYDNIAEGMATAVEAQRLSPKPRMRVQTYSETASGCIQFERELDRGTLRHFGQQGLNAAVSVATKRDVKGDRGIWLWSIGQRGDDITTLDAATRALKNWDQNHTRRSSGIKTYMGD